MFEKKTEEKRERIPENIHEELDSDSLHKISGKYFGRIPATILGDDSGILQRHSHEKQNP